MLKKILLFALVGALLAALASSSVVAAPPNDKISAQKGIIWRLSKAQVVNQGKLVQIEEGTLITDYTIEATATAKQADLVPDGKFQITLSAFSPKKDMPGQKAGRWYLRGKWTITSVNATRVSLKARYSPDVIRGTIATELDFNPLANQNGLTVQRSLTAQASLPMSPVGNRWGKGKGTWSVNSLFEGDLQLDLDRWPAKK